MAWKRNEYEYSSVSLPPNPLPARQLIFFSGAWRENPWREHLSPPKVHSVTRKGGGRGGLAEDTLSAGSSSSVGRGGGEGGREGRETGSKRVRMERDRGRIVLSDGMREIGEKGRSETDPGLGERERVGGRERERAREWEKKRSRGNG